MAGGAGTGGRCGSPEAGRGGRRRAMREPECGIGGAPGSRPPTGPAAGPGSGGQKTDAGHPRRGAARLHLLQDALQAVDGAPELLELRLVERDGHAIVGMEMATSVSPYSPTMSAETGRTLFSSRMIAWHSRLTDIAMP